MFTVVSLILYKQKTADEMRISDGSSDVCSSALGLIFGLGQHAAGARLLQQGTLFARRVAAAAHRQQQHHQRHHHHQRRQADKQWHYHASSDSGLLAVLALARRRTITTTVDRKSTRLNSSH